MATRTDLSSDIDGALSTRNSGEHGSRGVARQGNGGDRNMRHISRSEAMAPGTPPYAYSRGEAQVISAASPQDLNAPGAQRLSAPGDMPLRAQPPWALSRNQAQTLQSVQVYDPNGAQGWVPGLGLDFSSPKTWLSLGAGVAAGVVLFMIMRKKKK